MSKAKDERKRRGILQAATKIFGEKGFKATKISQIAREAGVADGTIYLYFKNKEDLLTAAFEFNMDQFIPQVKNTLKNLNHPLEQIRTFIEMHLQYIEEHQELARVFQVELHQNEKLSQERNNPKFHEYLELLNQTIQSAQDQAWIRSDIKPDIIKRILFGSLSEMALYRTISPETSPSLSECSQHVYQIIIEGLKNSEKLAGKPIPDEARLSAA